MSRFESGRGSEPQGPGNLAIQGPATVPGQDPLGSPKANLAGGYQAPCYDVRITAELECVGARGFLLCRLTNRAPTVASSFATGTTSGTKVPKGWTSSEGKQRWIAP